MAGRWLRFMQWELRVNHRSSPAFTGTVASDDPDAPGCRYCGAVDPAAKPADDDQFRVN
jgi:hypothetical protein